MNTKQRFIDTLRFQAVDHVPLMEICLWQQTKARWVAEGLPAEIDGAFMRGNAHFGLEGYDTLNFNATGPVPAVEAKLLEETAEYELFLDGYGRTRKALKSGTVGGMRMSMDQYIEFPVKDPASFHAFKPRFEGAVRERYPADWRAQVRQLKKSDKPLTLLDPLSGTFGFYSMLRNWMGTEGVSYLLYDHPALMEECLEFLSEFAVRVLTPAVKALRFDFYYIHEDMSFKNGPLVSPAMFRRFFLPHYKRLVGFLKSNGIDMVLVDTDGNCEALLPLFLEAGVRGFGPVEIAADMDPVKIRRQYGKALVMVGGVDKRAIAQGRKAIDAELKRHVAPIIDQGGFIPTIDHAIPPDISLADFEYYLARKRKIMGI